jgi:hypothetical protein
MQIQFTFERTKRVSFLEERERKKKRQERLKMVLNAGAVYG